MVWDLAKPSLLPGELSWPPSKYQRPRLSVQVAKATLHCLQGKRSRARTVDSHTLYIQALICLTVFILYRCDLIW